MYRIGFGFDVHRLVEGCDLWLGGVKIDYQKGLLGHSDADVLIHAICDALLGAANLGDIGQHFPDNDPSYEKIDSKILLGRTVGLIVTKGFQIANIDVTICAESPKIAPYIPEMKRILSAVMGINERDISIKATTTERLGYTGRGEGISAYAITLLYF